MIRVVVLDDAGLRRSGVCALLNRMASVEVVGEAGDTPELLRLIRQESPHIVVVLGSISTLNYIVAASDLRRESPGISFLLLSNKTKAYIRHALRHGFSGFVSMTAAPGELESAIRVIVEGQIYLSRDIDLAADQVSDQTSKQRELLSPRQSEVLQLIAEGQSTKQIADILDISVKTVETHRENLMRKLDIRDIAGLVRYAINIGLVE